MLRLSFALSLSLSYIGVVASHEKGRYGNQDAVNGGQKATLKTRACKIDLQNLGTSCRSKTTQENTTPIPGYDETISGVSPNAELLA